MINEILLRRRLRRAGRIACEMGFPECEVLIGGKKSTGTSANSDDVVVDVEVMGKEVLSRRRLRRVGRITYQTGFPGREFSAPGDE